MVPENISAKVVIHIFRVTNVIASMYNPTVVSPAVYTLTDLPWMASRNCGKSIKPNDRPTRAMTISCHIEQR